MCRRLSDCRGTGMPFGVVVRQFATVPLRGTGVLPMGYWSTPLRGTGVLPMGHRSTPYGVLEYSLRGTLSTPGVGGGAGGFRPTGRPLREESPAARLIVRGDAVLLSWRSLSAVGQTGCTFRGMAHRECLSYITRGRCVQCQRTMTFQVRPSTFTK